VEAYDKHILYVIGFYFLFHSSIHIVERIGEKVLNYKVIMMLYEMLLFHQKSVNFLVTGFFERIWVHYTKCNCN